MGLRAVFYILVFFAVCSILGVIAGLHVSPSIPSNSVISFPPGKNIQTVEYAKDLRLPSVTKTKSVILSLVGDCTLGTDTTPNYRGSFNEYYSKYSAGYFFRKVAPVFWRSDISVANLEGTLTNFTTAQDKEYRFRGLPEYAEILNKGGISAVNIANNHSKDYLEQGFNDTLAALEHYGINYFGDGYKWEVKVNDVPIVFLGYAQWRCSPTAMQRDISYYVNRGVLVVVSFHWGEELAQEPSPVQRQLAYAAIDSGASLVFGHHPHVLQPMEFYKGKLIAYSLGNFCFGGNVNPRDKKTLILQVKLFAQEGILKGYIINLIPCLISSEPSVNDYCPSIVTGDAARAIADNFAVISNYYYAAF